MTETDAALSLYRLMFGIQFLLGLIVSVIAILAYVRRRNGDAWVTHKQLDGVRAEMAAVETRSIQAVQAVSDSVAQISASLATSTIGIERSLGRIEGKLARCPKFCEA